MIAATAAAAGVLLGSPGAASATGVCNGHGGIAYAGADSRGGAVHIICMDGRAFDI